MWILCSRFERRVHASVNACERFDDGKCPLRPARAAVLRTDGTSGPRRPGTDRRHRVLVFTAPFAQADVEDDLDRAVAVHSMVVRADRTASGAHSQPAPAAPGAQAADSHARTATSRAVRSHRKKVGQRRGDAADQRGGSASHLARRHRRPTRQAAYDAVDTVRSRSSGSRESRRDASLRLRLARGVAHGEEHHRTGDRHPAARTSGTTDIPTGTAAPTRSGTPGPQLVPKTTKTGFGYLRNRPCSTTVSSRDDRI